MTTGGTTDDFKSQCPMAVGGQDAMQSVINFMNGVVSGALPGGASLSWQVGAVKAAGTATFTGAGPANGETCTVCGVTITAVTADAGENEFDISATPATVAANFAAAINESSDLTGIVTAEAELGVVTVSAVVPGLIGNGLVMADVDLANTAIVSFADGADGTAYTQSFL